MAARRYDPLVIVHNFTLFVDIFFIANPSYTDWFFIFVPSIAWKPRSHTTDYRINIYVLNFIQYETAFTINQTIPRDAEDCRFQLRAARVPHNPDGDEWTNSGDIYSWNGYWCNLCYKR